MATQKKMFHQHGNCIQCLKNTVDIASISNISETAWDLIRRNFGYVGSGKGADGVRVHVRGIQTDKQRESERAMEEEKVRV